MLVATTIFGGDMKSKIKNTLHYKSTTRWGLLVVLAVVVICFMAFASNQQKISKKWNDKENSLTLDELKMLAKKGDAISWEDFAPYYGQDIGSGLYIMNYPLESPYSVLVGGVPGKSPMYVHLNNTKTELYIDIRQEDIDEFIHE